jgi:hypothetical protein
LSDDAFAPIAAIRVDRRGIVMGARVFADAAAAVFKAEWKAGGAVKDQLGETAKLSNTARSNETPGFHA